MDTLYPILAVASTCCAALSLYLGAPRQQWLERPLPGRPSRIAGAALALVSLWLWMQVQQAGTAFFTLLTLFMTLFIALPYLAALRRLLKDSAP